MNKKYVSEVSKIFLKFKKNWNPILNNFLEKILFSPKGPPFDFFGHSVQTNMAKGGPKLKNRWGSSKIEVVPICLGNPHVHGEMQIHKFNFVPPP